MARVMSEPWIRTFFEDLFEHDEPTHAMSCASTGRVVQVLEAHDESLTLRRTTGVPRSRPACELGAAHASRRKSETYRTWLGLTTASPSLVRASRKARSAARSSPHPLWAPHSR